jgi:hypothetical protein
VILIDVSPEIRELGHTIPAAFQEKLQKDHLADEYNIKSPRTANSDADLTSEIAGDDDPLITRRFTASGMRCRSAYSGPRWQ